MTTLNYSISGLKGLLTDLNNLSACLVDLPQNHIDVGAYRQLQLDQHDLIQRINTYVAVLESMNAPAPDKKNLEQLRAIPTCS